MKNPVAASTPTYLENIFQLKKQRFLREMANSRSGTADEQDEPRISCHDRKQRLIKDYGIVSQRIQMPPCGDFH